MRKTERIFVPSKASRREFHQRETCKEALEKAKRISSDSFEGITRSPSELEPSSPALQDDQNRFIHFAGERRKEREREGEKTLKAVSLNSSSNIVECGGGRDVEFPSRVIPDG